MSRFRFYQDVKIALCFALLQPFSFTHQKWCTYLVPTHLVPTHLVPTPLVKLLSNYWFDPNKSDVMFEIFAFFDKSM